LRSADAIDGAYRCGLRYPPHSVATSPSLTAFRREFRDFVEDDAVQPIDLVHLPHRLVEARGGL
jgi:hypothetical protein